MTDAPTPTPTGPCFEVAAPTLRWALTCVLRSVYPSDARTPLDQIRVEHAGPVLNLISTDGHRLHHCELPVTQLGTALPAGQWTAASVRALLAAIPKRSAPPVMISLCGTGGAWATWAGEIRALPPGDGKYPDWRQVARHVPGPNGPAGVRTGVNPAYLREAALCVEELQKPDKRPQGPAVDVDVMDSLSPIKIRGESRDRKTAFTAWVMPQRR